MENYKGKKIILIGSGIDIDGRKLGERIDNGEWDYVCRVNKHYGSTEDVGTRTDIIITRKTAWLDNRDWFSEDEVKNAKVTVVLNEHIGYSAEEYEDLTSKVWHHSVSAGAQAIDYFINREADRIDVIGFGWKDGKRCKNKEYTQGSTGTTPTTGVVNNVDLNSQYNWEAEAEWEAAQPSVHLL